MRVVPSRLPAICGGPIQLYGNEPLVIVTGLRVASALLPHVSLGVTPRIMEALC